MNLKLLPIKQYFALIFAILIALNTTFAAPVSHDLAKQIASNFFIHKRVIDPNNEKNSKAPKIQSVELQEQHFFVFNYDSQQGYVIIAADDCAHPILGYATEGYFDMNNSRLICKNGSKCIKTKSAMLPLISWKARRK